MGQKMKVLSREVCPKCRDNGNDTKGDNLHVYEDGHKWCFACGYLEGKLQKTLVKSIKLPKVRDVALMEKGIGVQTLTSFQVGQEVDSTWYVIPYFNKERELVGVKYRSFAEQKKSGSKEIMYDGDIELYGLHMVSKQHTECILWEGETDTWSAYQTNPHYTHLGFPGSDTGKKLIAKHSAWLRERFDKIYICVHADDAGDKLRADIEAKLPVYKTYHMRMPSGFKDFNDVLMAGKAKEQFRLMMSRASVGDINDLLTGDELRDSFIQYAEDDHSFSGYSTRFDGLDEMLGGGLHLGEVFALVGHTGRGKSTFARDVAMNMAEEMPDDERILWIGTEMDANLMMRKFIERKAGKRYTRYEGKYSISREKVDEYLEELCERFVFYTNMYSDFDKVHMGILNAIYQHNTRVIFIDVLSDISTDFTDWQTAANIIARLHAIAQGDREERRPPVAMFLVSHTVGEEGVITLSNLRGGSAIRQKVTGVISFDGDIDSKEGIRHLKVLKKSRVYDCELLSSKVYFDEEMRRYYEYDQEPDRRERAATSKDAKRGLGLRSRKTLRSNKLQA
jgi:KaiC/GvpD/RAD55 family RecA-like ATPase